MSLESVATRMKKFYVTGLTRPDSNRPLILESNPHPANLSAHNERINCQSNNSKYREVFETARVNGNSTKDSITLLSSVDEGKSRQNDS